jgi:hypothetical protein
VTDDQKKNIKLLIATYEAMDADWSIALEYEVRKYNGNLPHQERHPNTRRNDRHGDPSVVLKRGRKA